MVLFFLIRTPDISFRTLCLPKRSRPYISNSGYHIYRRLCGETFTSCKKEMNVFFVKSHFCLFQIRLIFLRSIIALYYQKVLNGRFPYIFRSCLHLCPFGSRKVNLNPWVQPRNSKIHRYRHCLQIIQVSIYQCSKRVMLLHFSTNCHLISYEPKLTWSLSLILLISSTTKVKVYSHGSDLFVK